MNSAGRVSGLRGRGRISVGNWRMRLSFVQDGRTLLIVLSIDCRVNLQKGAQPRKLLEA